MPERAAFERFREVTRPSEEQETPNHEQGLEEESFQLSNRPLGSDSTEDFLNSINILTACSSFLVSEKANTR